MWDEFSLKYTGVLQLSEKLSRTMHFKMSFSMVQIFETEQRSQDIVLNFQEAQNWTGFWHSVINNSTVILYHNIEVTLKRVLL